MKEEETIISKLVVKEQSEFEEWILKNTALGYSALRGWRDEFGIVDYEDIDIKISGQDGLLLKQDSSHGKGMFKINILCK